MQPLSSCHYCYIRRPTQGWQRLKCETVHTAFIIISLLLYSQTYTRMTEAKMCAMVRIMKILHIIPFEYSLFTNTHLHKKLYVLSYEKEIVNEGIMVSVIDILCHERRICNSVFWLKTGMKHHYSQAVTGYTVVCAIWKSASLRGCSFPLFISSLTMYHNSKLLRCT